jgi:ATP-dependent DNA helicase RecQ
MAWKSMLERGSEEIEPDPKFIESATKHLIDIDRYSSGTVCRHRALVEYFGQQYSSPDCRACDLCLGETEDVDDALVVAQKIVSCVYRVNQSFGVGHVISVLRGEENDKVRERGHDRLSTFGLLKGRTRNEIRDWIYQLVNQGFLEQTNDIYPVLHLTEASRALMRGTAEVRLRQPVVTRSKSSKKERARLPLDTSLYDRDLFEALRAWRRAEAQERGVPPYVIFGDRTLRELARAMPSTLTELRGIYGIGDAKLEAFGSALLEIIGASAASPT